MKSDRSAEVLRHFGLGRTIGFQAAVSDTSGGKRPVSDLYDLVTELHVKKVAHTRLPGVRFLS